MVGYCDSTSQTVLNDWTLVQERNEINKFCMPRYFNVATSCPDIESSWYLPRTEGVKV